MSPATLAFSLIQCCHCDYGLRRLRTATYTHQPSSAVVLAVWPENATLDRKTTPCLRVFHFTALLKLAVNTLVYEFCLQCTFFSWTAAGMKHSNESGMRGIEHSTVKMVVSDRQVGTSSAYQQVGRNHRQCECREPFSLVLATWLFMHSKSTKSNLSFFVFGCFGCKGTTTIARYVLLFLRNTRSIPFKILFLLLCKRL